LIIFGLRVLIEYGMIYAMRISFRIGMFCALRIYVVVRKAERQDDDKENELMINTFLNPAPRTPAVHGGLKKKRNTDMIYIGKA